MDPKFRGLHLSEEQKHSTEIVFIAKLVAGHGKRKRKKNSKFPFGFCHFFFCFNSAPASSASIERYLYTFGLVLS
ncbi:hypothetical protein PR048_009325, partial [Dryococelus australis]